MSFTKTGTTICGAVFNVSFHATANRLISQICFFRAELYSLLIQEPLLAPSSLTRTAQSSIPWHLTFTLPVLVQLPIVTTFLVSIIISATNCEPNFLKRVLTKNINFAAEMIKRELELHRFNTHSENRV